MLGINQCPKHSLYISSLNPHNTIMYHLPFLLQMGDRELWGLNNMLKVLSQISKIILKPVFLASIYCLADTSSQRIFKISFVYMQKQYVSTHTTKILESSSSLATPPCHPSPLWINLRISFQMYFSIHLFMYVCTKNSKYYCLWDLFKNINIRI